MSEVTRVKRGENSVESIDISFDWSEFRPLLLCDAASLMMCRLLSGPSTPRLHARTPSFCRKCSAERSNGSSSNRETDGTHDTTETRRDEGRPQWSVDEERKLLEKREKRIGVTTIRHRSIGRSVDQLSVDDEKMKLSWTMKVLYSNAGSLPYFESSLIEPANSPFNEFFHSSLADPAVTAASGVQIGLANN